MDLHTFQILINCFVYSHIEYCLPVWGFQSTHHLQRIQNKIKFLLTSYVYPGSHNRSFRRNRNQCPCVPIDYLQLLDRWNLITVPERLLYFYALYCFKTVTNQHIEENYSHFVFIPNSTKNNLRLVRHGTSLFVKSVFYQSSKTWNSINPELKNTLCPSFLSNPSCANSFENVVQSRVGHSPKTQ